MQRFVMDAIQPRAPRFAIAGMLVGFVLIGGVVASDKLLQRHVLTSKPIAQAPDCILITQPDPVQVAYPEANALTPIALERRWLRGPFVSPAEVDVALGEGVPAWQEFLYAHDAAPRFAIASEVYSSASAAPSAQFFADRDGGIWAIDEHETPMHLSPRAEILYMRDVFLLPTGSHFRGVLRR